MPAYNPRFIPAIVKSADRSFIIPSGKSGFVDAEFNATKNTLASNAGHLICQMIGLYQENVRMRYNAITQAKEFDRVHGQKWKKAGFNPDNFTSNKCWNQLFWIHEILILETNENGMPLVYAFKVRVRHENLHPDDDQPEPVVQVRPSTMMVRKIEQLDHNVFIVKVENFQNWDQEIRRVNKTRLITSFNLNPYASMETIRAEGLNDTKSVSVFPKNTFNVVLWNYGSKVIISTNNRLCTKGHFEYFGDPAVVPRINIETMVEYAIGDRVEQMFNPETLSVYQIAIKPDEGYFVIDHERSINTSHYVTQSSIDSFVNDVEGEAEEQKFIDTMACESNVRKINREIDALHATLEIVKDDANITEVLLKAINDKETERDDIVIDSLTAPPLSPPTTRYENMCFSVFDSVRETFTDERDIMKLGETNAANVGRRFIEHNVIMITVKEIDFSSDCVFFFGFVEVVA